MKKFFAIFAAFSILMCFASCNAAKKVLKSTEKKVSILLPSESAWGALGNELKYALDKEGFETTLMFSDSLATPQDAQIHECVANKANAILLAPVNDDFVANAVSEALSAGIAVVGVDGAHHDNWTASIEFDPDLLGQELGNAIVEAFSLSTAAVEERSYSIEFFMGSAEDEGAQKIHKSMYEVLGPYLATNALVCNTGRTQFQDTNVWQWSDLIARDFCANYLRNYYAKKELSIVCCASNSLVRGTLSAIDGSEYVKNFPAPAVVGIGDGEEALNRIREGKQRALVYKDPKNLSSACIEYLKGYFSTSKSAGDSGMSAFCSPTIVTSENIHLF